MHEYKNNIVRMYSSKLYVRVVENIYMTASFQDWADEIRLKIKLN